MIITKYLVIAASKGRYGGWNTKAKIVEKEPKLHADEISLRLELDIPNAFFERPYLQAKMTVPAEAMKKPKIDVAVTDNIEKIIKETTGLTMSVNLIQHDDESNSEEGGKDKSQRR